MQSLRGGAPPAADGSETASEGQAGEGESTGAGAEAEAEAAEPASLTDPAVVRAVELLYDTALLGSGFVVEEPSGFVSRVRRSSWSLHSHARHTRAPPHARVGAEAHSHLHRARADSSAAATRCLLDQQR